MKKQFLEILEDIGYPYERLNALQKSKVKAIHKQIFNKSNQYYQERNCSSCYISMLNDLAIRFELPKVGELTKDYQKRLEICRSCSATKGQDGKVLICGKLGKKTEGRYPTCGCFLNVKARIKSMHCPRKKW